MKEGRRAFAIVVFVFIAVIAIFLTLYFVRDWAQRQAKPPAPPVTKPPITAPLPPPIDVEKPKEADKPKTKDDVKPKEDGKKPPKDDPAKPKDGADLGPGKVRLCPNSREAASIAEDGRLLNHHPYANANASDLAGTPQGFGQGSCTQLQGEARAALERMIAAAKESDPAIGNAMIGLSCFRSASYQREVFCRKVADGFAVRAQASAPPGFSEHATGYAIDFGDRNVPKCNLNPCFATTPVGEWLAANAGQYGFVLSFPKGNAQGVMYEPWHWRYQGSSAAQGVFAAAN